MRYHRRKSLWHRQNIADEHLFSLQAILAKLAYFLQLLTMILLKTLIVRAQESTVRYSPQRELKLLTLFEE